MHNLSVLGMPRRWWGGPLDVEGLALSSVQLALGAAQRLGHLRGWTGELSTSADLVGPSFDSQRLLRIDGRATEPFAPLSGFFPTADGWVRLHGNYPHHAAAIRAALDIDRGTHEGEPAQDLRTAVADRLTSWRSTDVESAVRAHGGAAAAYRTAGQWWASPMAAVATEPWIHQEPGDGTGSGPLPDGGPLPLSGVRVLDLTRVIAGPTGTRLLAQLGADVLRLDPPHRPELLDQHLDTGFGKRSAVADLRDPAQHATVHGLLADGDVLLTGYRPGALRAFGLATDQVRARHPHLAAVSVCAWGWTGPWSGERGFDSLVQVATGIAHRYADGGRPGALPVQALDHATGYGMAAAVCDLLAQREHAGGGSARLSLASTAHRLLAAPPSDAPIGEISPRMVTTRSAHGLLEHVAGPVLLDGALLPHAGPPGEYGAADLAWLPR